MSMIEELLKKMVALGMIWDYAVVDSITTGVSKDVLVKPTSQSQFALLQI